MAPGVFVWRWERVIPNNVTLFLFELQPHSIETRLSGELPSAEAVAGMLPGAADFRYQATVTVTFAVRPEALPELVSGQGLTPEDLAQWTEMQGIAVGRAAWSCCSGVPRPRHWRTWPRAKRRSSTRWLPGFRICRYLHVRFSDLRLPDIEIYERARRAYLELMDAQYEARRAAVIDLAPRTGTGSCGSGDAACRAASAGRVWRGAAGISNSDPVPGAAEHRRPGRLSRPARAACSYGDPVADIPGR